MQASPSTSVLTASDMSEREGFPYYRWMHSEGIPIHSDVAGFSDIRDLSREPWARTGKGLGAFLELTGTFQAERGMFVCEIPPGESLDVEHHLYEQFVLILQGQGVTEVWQRTGAKRMFEWGKGSVFAPPKNAYYRMFNVGREPVLYFGVTNAPRIINGLFSGSNMGNRAESRFRFVFECDFDFDDYELGETYFSRTEERITQGTYNSVAWYTNFIPNVNEERVDDQEQKVSGGQLTYFEMTGGFPAGHISEWPVGRYHKAHFHAPGAVLIGLKGKGYVNLWPSALGVHPWQDGHADQVALVQWGPNSIYSPPDGWFHQHMSCGNVPARHVAVYGGGGSPLGTRSGNEAESWYFKPVREGGCLIEYEDEDPEVRRYFIEVNRAEGVECSMPPVIYRTDPITWPKQS